MNYLNKMKGAGVTLSLSEYRDLASINRDDMVLWNDAETQRALDDAELARSGDARD